MQPTEFITVQPPAGIVADQFLGKPDSNRPTVYDLGRQVNLANESAAPTDRYPVSIRETTQEVWVKNATVIGTQPRGLTWRQMKSDYDGDAVRMETSGQKTVDGLYAENVEDAFSPRGFGPWTLQNSWLRWIRDDVVENDSLLSGTIENCLCDGVFMGLSCRPGAQTPPEAYAETKFTVAIRNSLIHLQKMPNGDTRFMDGEGNAHGKLFK